MRVIVADVEPRECLGLLVKTPTAGNRFKIYRVWLPEFGVVPVFPANVLPLSCHREEHGETLETVNR